MEYHWSPATRSDSRFPTSPCFGLLHLLRALGGAGRAVIDLLENRPQPDLQQAPLPNSDEQTRRVLAEATDRGVDTTSAACHWMSE